MKQFTPMLLLAVLVCTPAALAASADKKAEAERQQEAREDAAAEGKRGELPFEAQVRGTIRLQVPESEKNSGAVGIFETPQATYLLKLGRPELQKLIEAHDGKQVLLDGRIRNDGKYFIVENVNVPLAPTPRKTGGRGRSI